MRRRLITVLFSMLTILALTASSALAHFCYNASRSDQGNQAVASNSSAFMTVEEFISFAGEEFGLCEAGVHYLHAFADEEGLSDKLVHTRALMAGGAVGKEIMSNGRGIDHLPESELMSAFELCGPPV